MYPLYKIIYRVKAYDNDSRAYSSLHYSLQQPNRLVFGMDANTGDLYLIQKIDYEEQTEYHIVVKATDEGGYSSNILIDVKVQDVNDNEPYFGKQLHYIQVKENFETSLPVK